MAIQYESGIRDTVVATSVEIEMTKGDSEYERTWLVAGDAERLMG